MLQEYPGEVLTAILDHPDRRAVVVPEDGQVLTYGQVADRVASLAGSLAAAGVGRGDRVAVTLPNGPDMVQVLLAITALGAAAAPLNPAYTHSEYVFYLTDIAPRVFVMPASRPAAASSAAGECSMTVLTALAGGGSVIVPRRFTPQRFWQQAREHGATWLSAGPTLHQMILERADDGGAPATLRFARSCSSALSPALMERAELGYGVPMLEAYGMTEASHQMASNPLPPEQRIAGSVGVATGTEIGIADQDGTMLPQGSLGQGVIRGPGVMSGYVNNPAATAEAFFGAG